MKQNVSVMNDSAQVFIAVVDERDPRNKNPKQRLETSEKIDVILLKRTEVRNFLLSEIRKGSAIGPGVWFFSMMKA